MSTSLTYEPASEPCAQGENKVVSLVREGNVAVPQSGVGGIGLGIQQDDKGQHVVSAMMPRGAAERCELIDLGDRKPQTLNLAVVHREP